jgi:hypothetical protein
MYMMQVKVDGVWKAVKPSSDDTPYTFENWDEAKRTLEMCYPDQCRESRLSGDHQYTGEGGIVRITEE